VLACDLPHLDPAVLRTWAMRLADAPAAVEACLARTQGGKSEWEPLCGFYRGRCLAGIRRYLHSGGHSFAGWLARVEVFALSVPDRRMFFNCNTPQDVEGVGG
jgi:molybdopterin-guanine dinucleotide biosynthesis protein A